MSGLVLYLRAGCHLCREAEAELARAGVAASPVDIAGDPALEAAYGVRIPVLADPAGGRELDWPFDGAAAAAFAAGAGG